jgi:hypothetical protein
MAIKMHVCPECGAKVDEPCRTPKGRKKLTMHDTRPFSVTLPATPPIWESPNWQGVKPGDPLFRKK